MINQRRKGKERIRTVSERTSRRGGKIWQGEKRGAAEQQEERKARGRGDSALHGQEKPGRRNDHAQRKGRSPPPSLKRDREREIEFRGETKNAGLTTPGEPVGYNHRELEELRKNGEIRSISPFPRLGEDKGSNCKRESRGKVTRTERESPPEWSERVSVESLARKEVNKERRD